MPLFPISEDWGLCEETKQSQPLTLWEQSQKRQILNNGEKCYAKGLREAQGAL